MNKCPRCETNELYEEFEFCEGCMNEMLLPGGQSFAFTPDSNFYKEIGIDQITEKKHKDLLPKGIESNE